MSVDRQPLSFFVKGAVALAALFGVTFALEPRPEVNGLRVLILAARALKGRHGRLVFARPQPLVAKLLEITGADRLLEVQE